MAIQFGTSGWRAELADELTFAGVRSGTGASCSHFGSQNIGSNGSFTSPNQLIALLFDYLVESKQWSGGFKYIGDLINENKIVIGGEESAGLSIQGHYPEKDGILAGLLAAEAVAARGTSLTEQLNALYARVGKLESGRTGIRMTPRIMKTLPDKLEQYQKEVGGRRVDRTNPLDAVKLFLATAPDC